MQTPCPGESNRQVYETEAPDDETATAFALTLGAQVNLRTTTMRAFDEGEMQAIIAETA